MGFLKALGIVKDAETELKLDIRKIRELEQDTELLKSEIEELLRTVEAGDTAKTRELLTLLKEQDHKIFDILKQTADKKQYQKAKHIHGLISTIMRSSSQDLSKYGHFSELVSQIDHDVIQLLRMELNELKESREILHDFDALCTTSVLTEEMIEGFFSKHSNIFKANPHRKLGKQIKKELTRLIEDTVKNAPGPIMKEKEIVAVKTKLTHYFRSHNFKELFNEYDLKGTKIIVALFGSLVTGFASRYSRHPGVPTDSEELSDVDIAIIIDDKSIFKRLTLAGPRGLLLKKGGFYYGPLQERSAERLGPFMKIFRYLKHLSFAGSSKRKIGIVLVDTDFYLRNMKKEEHIKLCAVVV